MASGRGALSRSRVRDIADRAYQSARVTNHLMRVSRKFVVADRRGYVLGCDPSALSDAEWASVGLPTSPRDGAELEAALAVATRAHCLDCAHADRTKFFVDRGHLRRRTRSAEDAEIAERRVAGCRFLSCPFYHVRISGWPLEAVVTSTALMAYRRVTRIALASSAEIARHRVASYCLECRGGEADAVTVCPRVLCPFWRFRPYDRARAAEIVEEAMSHDVGEGAPPSGCSRSVSSLLTSATHALSVVTRQLRSSESGGRALATIAAFVADQDASVSDEVVAARDEIGLPPDLGYLSAVDETCAICQRGSAERVRACARQSCAFWPVRPDGSGGRAVLGGRERVSRARIAESLDAVGVSDSDLALLVRRFCRSCRGGQDAEIAACRVVTCPLWNLRPFGRVLPTSLTSLTTTRAEVRGEQIAADIDAGLMRVARLSYDERMAIARGIVASVASGSAHVPNIARALRVETAGRYACSPASRRRIVSLRAVASALWQVIAECRARALASPDDEEARSLDRAGDLIALGLPPISRYTRRRVARESGLSADDLPVGSLGY